MSRALANTEVKESFSRGIGIDLPASNLMQKDVGKIIYAETATGAYLGKISYIFHTGTGTVIHITALSDATARAEAKVPIGGLVHVATEDQL